MKWIKGTPSVDGWYFVWIPKWPPYVAHGERRFWTTETGWGRTPDALAVASGGFRNSGAARGC